jgi:SAM-dependent methyltransferase
MTSFEWQYLCAVPFLPALYREVKKRLSPVVRSFSQRPEILDVGGRKSHYTIGIPAEITIAELPRVSDVQEKLHLGITDAIMEQTKARRSNIRTIVYDDMTHSKLPDASYDTVISVEVLEHVEEDEKFVKEVYRVLRPGGVFIMTTPNGEFVPNNNPDHKRHYRRQQLHDVLATAFETVQVDFAVKAGMFYEMGLWSWSIKRPIRTLLSMFGNVANGFQSGGQALKNQSQGTVHLIAVAKKSANATTPAPTRDQAFANTASS